MQIGIGLPATIPGATGSEILAWAKRADDGPFSSLGIIDRLVYSNFDSMMTLSAVAAVTKRIRLIPSILLAPLRPAVVLAKEAATLDALSGGRLTLGLGLGSRESDYQAVGVSFKERGHVFDEQLRIMKQVWTGAEVVPGAGPTGPKPVQTGGPPLLIGGAGATALRRAGAFGDGYIGAQIDPQTARAFYEQALSSWRDANRTGQPRFVMGIYFALGPDAAKGAEYINAYYAFDPHIASLIAGSILSSPEAIRNAIQAYGEAGVDEIIFWPTIGASEQVELLAGVIAH